MGQKKPPGGLHDLEMRHLEYVKAELEKFNKENHSPGKDLWKYLKEEKIEKNYDIAILMIIISIFMALIFYLNRHWMY